MREELKKMEGKKYNFEMSFLQATVNVGMKLRISNFLQNKGGKRYRYEDHPK